MKDYKLSELRELCINQRKMVHNCKGCLIEEECDKYFSWSYSPAQWDIEKNKETNNEEDTYEI